MEQPVNSLSSVAGRKANRVGDCSTLTDAEVEAKANKQRRKIQNRKNQRARRMRTREQGPESAQTSLPFQVRRWRLDEFDACPLPNDLSASDVATAMYSPPQPHCTSVGTSLFTSQNAELLQERKPTAPIRSQTPPAPPSIVFPFSADHLLHLVQYNVFRAFVFNKRTLNLVLKGWTGNPSPTVCPLSGPYRDDTMIYPLNPNIPPALVPTHLQQTCLHSVWINLFPFPRLRDNLIRREGIFNHWDLLQDLIGVLMGATPERERRDILFTMTVSNPKTKNPSLAVDCYEDEVTAGRKGLIVWGEPYDMHSWEATPGFLSKWWWVVEGCHELIESSNRWRLMRGEEPIRPSELRMEPTFRGAQADNVSVGGLRAGNENVNSSNQTLHGSFTHGSSEQHQVNSFVMYPKGGGKHYLRVV